MKTETATGKTDQVIQLLDATKNQLEKFRTELSKTQEPEKKYRALKEELKTSIVEMKTMIDNSDSANTGLIDSLRQKLSVLEDELNTSNQSVLEDLKIHLSNIKNTLVDIVNQLNQEGTFNDTLERIHDRLHQFKIKFEIVKLKLALGKMEMRDAVRDQKHQFVKKVKALKKFVGENEEAVEKKWKHFRKEVDEVYNDLHKTFTSN